MERDDYPALANNPRLIHLDTSAAFPLHGAVIEAINEAVLVCGSAGKASYDGSMTATRDVESVRKNVADFIDAKTDEVFFVSSATEATRLLVDQWCKGHVTVYSPEDHLATVEACRRADMVAREIFYAENGEYAYSQGLMDGADAMIVNHMHHLYGVDNAVGKIRNSNPDMKLIVDASQSVSRMAISVKQMDCDALFFSAQKLGGVAGVGVLYIKKKHQPTDLLSLLERSTLPLVPIMALGAAVDVLRAHLQPLKLAELTVYLMHKLDNINGLQYAKGPAFDVGQCHGNGIVSFSVDGFDSADIAMALDDAGIAIRAGDHCVDERFVDRNVARISLQMYNSVADIDACARVLNEMVG